MPKIDSHQHFWKFDPIRDTWIPDEMALLRKDFLPDQFAPLLEQNGFDGCVTVQSEQAEIENVFQLENAKNNKFIKGIVGWVDFQAKNVGQKLSYYKEFEKIKGFRHILQGEAHRDLMLKTEFLRGIEALGEYDYTYDILIYADQVKFTKEFVAKFPNQKFVIDHLAKPYIKRKEIDGWKKDIQQVAEYENVSCKISGFLTEADMKHWKEEDFIPYFDVVVESFGIDRIMFGSDWPVCLGGADYNTVVNIMKKYFLSFTVNEQDKFFGDNAIKFYNL
ncbi:amidohydrolase family protein [Ginsengibacter hankyongi]|uniref:Amidohydrolase family protein n=1 Tax=Ginsengibacter hankyongi TaxID=2607284 RepID=A0A5J5IHS7_9BACT|nr:amidohydrolase family protein [Ginsengibacter hankyongi]KAA9037584.1 amidohydrolase family protein [Ginsengibacter hankyongi]